MLQRKERANINATTKEQSKMGKGTALITLVVDVVSSRASTVAGKQSQTNKVKKKRTRSTTQADTLPTAWCFDPSDLLRSLNALGTLFRHRL